MDELEQLLNPIIEEIKDRKTSNAVELFMKRSTDPVYTFLPKENEFLNNISEKLKGVIESQKVKPKVIIEPNLLEIIELANKIPERIEQINSIRISDNYSGINEETFRQEVLFLDHALSILRGFKKEVIGENKTEPVPAPAPEQEPPKQGFLLLAQNGTHPPRYEHEYYDEAETEAKRLALLTKGYVHILHKVATVAPSYQVVITTVEYKGKTNETKEETIDLTRDSDLPF